MAKPGSSVPRAVQWLTLLAGSLLLFGLMGSQAQPPRPRTPHCQPAM